jgi:Flp pilus assembly protein TadB
MREHAVDRLHHDDRDVQRDGDGESAAMACGWAVVVMVVAGVGVVAVGVAGLAWVAVSVVGVIVIAVLVTAMGAASIAVTTCIMTAGWVAASNIPGMRTVPTAFIT